MATAGTGKNTYELAENWAELLKGWTLGQTGIVTDARDRVYLFNRGEHPLIVLDRDGAFVTSSARGCLYRRHLKKLKPLLEQWRPAFSARP
jgi:hypothetical protein